jgi:hypothetical protein
MNRQAPIRPEDAPGHYGAGYGEQVPEDAPPRPAPVTDDENPARATTPADTSVTPGTPLTSCTSGTSGTSSNSGTSSTSGTSPADDGEPVVFTPEDVSARPPDHTPTENAPASEKAGLIFERS